MSNSPNITPEGLEVKALDGSPEAGSPSAARSTEARESRAYYLRYARGERRMSQWDAFVGIWPRNIPLSKSPGFYRAATARRMARAYGLEEATGKAHCHCHLGLAEKCPTKPDTKPYWQRGTAARSALEGARG